MSELTKESFLRAMDAIRERSEWPVKAQPHIVSPKAMKQGAGWCVECGSWVEVLEPDVCHYRPVRPNQN